MGKRLLIAVKLTVAFGILVLLAFSLELEEFFGLMRSIPWYAFLVAAAIVVVQAVLLAIRWRDMAAFFARTDLPMRESLTAILISFFFAQGLPASIGGDAVRIWLLKERSSAMRVRDGVKAILVDRFWGFLALLFLACAGLASLAVAQQQLAVWLVPIAIAAGGAVAVIVALVSWPKALLRILNDLAERISPLLYRAVDSLTRLKADFDFFNRSRWRFGKTFAISFVVHVLTLCIALVFVLTVPSAVNWSAVSVLQLLAAIAPALLVGYLPISIAGWGVREGAMVVSLGLVGVSMTQAVAISLFVGVTVLLVSLLGGVLWIFSAVRRSHAYEGLSADCPSSSSG